MRYVILALLLFAAAMILAQVERESLAFTPILRVRSIDGMYITLVQSRTARRTACAGVLDGFKQALARTCATCALEFADCATHLLGIDRSLASGERLPIFTVEAGSLRAGLLGPPRSVQAECEAMASQFVRSGLAPAACIAPLPGSSS